MLLDLLKLIRCFVSVAEADEGSSHRWSGLMYHYMDMMMIHLALNNSVELCDLIKSAVGPQKRVCSS